MNITSQFVEKYLFLLVICCCNSKILEKSAKLSHDIFHIKNTAIKYKNRGCTEKFESFSSPIWTKIRIFQWNASPFTEKFENLAVPNWIWEDWLVSTAEMIMFAFARQIFLIVRIDFFRQHTNRWREIISCGILVWLYGLLFKTFHFHSFSQTFFSNSEY